MLSINKCLISIINKFYLNVKSTSLYLLHFWCAFYSNKSPPEDFVWLLYQDYIREEALAEGSQHIDHCHLQYPHSSHLFCKRCKKRNCFENSNFFTVKNDGPPPYYY